MKKVTLLTTILILVLTACSAKETPASATSGGSVASQEAANVPDEASSVVSTTQEEEPAEKELLNASEESASGEDDKTPGFDEEAALEKIQGVWTSVGHSQSESWVINDLVLREYMAIWDKDMTGSTDEYELYYEGLIDSLSPDTGRWEGEFTVRFMDRNTYFVYKESDNEIMLECHWDEDGYSMTDSMIKDDETRAGLFPVPTADHVESFEPGIDISQCASFEDIIDQLDPGRGYAQVRIRGVDLLLVSEGTFFDGNREAAIDAEVYAYVDGSPEHIGFVASNGTAYPLSQKDNMLFCAGNHWGAKYTVYDNQLFLLFQVHEVFDTGGNATYYYRTGGVAERETYGDSAITGYFDDFREADVISFEKK